jgi:hypothetical protein
LIETESEVPEDRKHAVAMNMKGGEVMHVDFNSILLLIIAVELALVYVKLPRK